MSSRSEHPIEPSRSAEESMIAMAQDSIDRHTAGNIDSAPEAFSSSYHLEDLVRLTLNGASQAESHADPSPDGATNAPFPANARLGRFRLIRCLGYGGFGIVLLAFDPRLQRQVALKLPRPELLNQRHWRKRFVHEARAVAALDHSNIVKLHDIGRVGPVLYLTSAYCEGPTLGEWLREHKPVPIRMAAELAAQLCDAVQHAHNRGVLHRDLKPANILLALPKENTPPATPNPLVTDFGLASRADSRESPENGTGGGLLGTLPYLAPEQTSRRQLDITTTADIYSLGAILYELLADRPPFIGSDKESLIREIQEVLPPSVRVIRPDVPRDLMAICDRCLAKEPSCRYESAAEMGRDLRRFLIGDCVTARPLPRLHRFVRWCHKRPTITVLAASLLVATSLGSAVGINQWQRAEANLDDTKTAVIDLGWAIDDAVFWRGGDDQFGLQQQEALAGRYVALLEKLGEHPQALPVQAAADCFAARMDDFGGRYDAATEKYESSIAGWHKVVRESPNDLASRRAMARTLYCYALHSAVAEEQGTSLHCFEGDKFFGRFSLRDSVDCLIVNDYADVLYAKAEALRERKQRYSAGEHFAACIHIYQELTKQGIANLDWELRKLQSEVRLLSVVRTLPSAESPFSSRAGIIRRLRKLVTRHPVRKDVLLEFAKLAAWMSVNASRHEQATEVESLLREAIATLEPIMTNDSSAAELQKHFAQLSLRLAQLLSDKGESDAAVSNAEIADEWYQCAYATGAVSLLQVAQASRSIADVYKHCEHNAQATRCYQRAIERYQIAMGSAARGRQLHLQYSDAWASLAVLYIGDGSNEKAVDAYQNAIEVLERWRGTTPREPHVAEQLQRLKSRLRDAQQQNEAGGD